MPVAWKLWTLGAWSLLVLVTATGAAFDAAAAEAATRAGPAVAAAPPASREPSPGSATAAGPTGVEAPAVGLAASLVPVGKTADGALAVPDFGVAGWYQHSVRPGDPGAAVLAGHVDNLSGPDVFFPLRDLVPGDEVVVRYGDGTGTTFVVDRTEITDKDALPVERVFDDPARPELRLITCGGDFDRADRSYDSNVIVYARMP